MKRFLVVAALMLSPAIAQAQCVSTASSWWSQGLPQTISGAGVWKVEFDLTSAGLTPDAVVGASAAKSSTYGNLSAIIRYGGYGMAAGTVQAFSGTAGTYVPTTLKFPTAGVAFHFELDVTPSTGQYDAYVTPAGGSKTTIATGLKFRSQSASLGFIGGATSAGSAQVCNISVTQPALPPPQQPGPPSGTVSVLSTTPGTLTISGTLNGSPVSQSYDSSPATLSFAFNLASHAVKLNWTASSSTGVTGYQVFRSQTSGTYPSTPLASVSGVSYTDSTVALGQTYYYVVQAVNSAGNSPNSNEVTTAVPSQ